MAEQEPQRGPFAVFPGIQLARFFQRRDGFPVFLRLGGGVTDPELGLGGRLGLRIFLEQTLETRGHFSRALQVAENESPLHHGIFAFLGLTVLVDHDFEIGQSSHVVARLHLGEGPLGEGGSDARVTRILQQKTCQHFDRFVIAFGLQLAPREFVKRVGSVFFRAAGRRGLAVKLGGLGETILTEEQLGFEQRGFGPIVLIVGRGKEGIDLSGSAFIALGHEADQAVKARIARGLGIRILRDKSVIKGQRAGLFPHLAARIGGEEQDVRLRFGRQHGQHFLGPGRRGRIIFRFVFQTDQSGLRCGTPVGQFLVGRAHFEQRSGRFEIAQVDGEQTGFDRRADADRGRLRRIGQTAQLAEGTVGQTGTCIGLGQIENGAVAVGIVLFLRGHFAVGRERFDFAAGGIEGAAFEKFGGQTQLRIAHMVRGKTEGCGRRVEFTPTVLDLAEAVSGRPHEIARVVFGKQFAVGHGGFLRTFERTQAFAEPEERGLAVHAPQCGAEELLVFRHREVVHLLPVECVGLLEGLPRRIGGEVGRRGTDRFGAVGRIDGRQRSCVRRCCRCHGFRSPHFGCRSSSGRIHRFGGAHLDGDLSVRRETEAEQRGNDQHAPHESGRPVAKATFQILAARQISSTATI